MEETPQRALVVTPHPDDAEIWCGGTIARWIKEGAEVHYVLCTDGSKGTDQPGITTKELSATREVELVKAAELLGVQDVVMLHYPDGELEDTTEFRKQIVRRIRQVQPRRRSCVGDAQAVKDDPGTGGDTHGQDAEQSEKQCRYG